jgi:adenylate cyclase
MKRLTYISKISRPLSEEEIEEIGIISVKNNHTQDITGILLCLGGIFFQIMEGEADKINHLYKKILKDDRHTEILCLKTEDNVQTRLFPDWSMKTINLDTDTDIFIQPIKTLLKTVTDSHRILEKYTQPTIFRIINSGINPLEVAPRASEKIVLFSDIVSFSTFVEKLPVEDVVAIVNQYLTIVTDIITARSGEVTKFIGDCVMAYFSADQADNAIQASLDILAALETLRSLAPDHSPLRILYSGVGLAQGVVIEGNIGSAVKKDYTILGDAVNVAQRLEALTRKLSWPIVFSIDVKNSLNQAWDFVSLGAYYPKGKEEPIEIYSITHSLTQTTRKGHEIAEEISHYLDEIK